MKEENQIFYITSELSNYSYFWWIDSIKSIIFAQSERQADSERHISEGFIANSMTKKGSRVKYFMINIDPPMKSFKRPRDARKCSIKNTTFR